MYQNFKQRRIPILRQSLGSENIFISYD